jgi:hypothetical protein
MARVTTALAGRTPLPTPLGFRASIGMTACANSGHSCKSNLLKLVDAAEGLDTRFGIRATVSAVRFTATSSCQAQPSCRTRHRVVRGHCDEEDMATKMSLSPNGLACDYMLRTNIITPERLAAACPRQ